MMASSINDSGVINDYKHGQCIVGNFSPKNYFSVKTGKIQVAAIIGCLLEMIEEPKKIQQVIEFINRTSKFIRIKSIIEQINGILTMKNTRYEEKRK